MEISNIHFFDYKGVKIAEIKSGSIEIHDSQDALDLMADCSYIGNAEKIIIQERNFTPDFFDLKSGIAGEILQKFSNYGVSLAIVGDFSKYTSKSLRDFIYESNKNGRILFVGSENEARERLTNMK